MNFVLVNISDEDFASLQEYLRKLDFVTDVNFIRLDINESPDAISDAIKPESTDCLIVYVDGKDNQGLRIELLDKVSALSSLASERELPLGIITRDTTLHLMLAKILVCEQLCYVGEVTQRKDSKEEVVNFTLEDAWEAIVSTLRIEKDECEPHADVVVKVS